MLTKTELLEMIAEMDENDLNSELGNLNLVMNLVGNLNQDTLDEEVEEDFEKFQKINDLFQPEAVIMTNILNMFDISDDVQERYGD